MKKINSKNKGNVFENDIAKQLMARFVDCEFARTPGSGAYSTTHNLPSFLDLGGDIITPENFRFTIECKCGYSKDVSLHGLFSGNNIFYDFLDQVERDCSTSGKLPLLIYKALRRPVLACVPVECDPGINPHILFRGRTGHYRMLKWSSLIDAPRDFFFK